MAEEEETDELTEEESNEDEPDTAEKSGGPKIMCFVSKEMVPTEDTVEVEYSSGKTVRVLPKYIKFERAEEEATA